MSLATVIRMEFAYPGVGILAGDSIQYLSIATAHGVIMVFFMIMPAIFGAFGNFLLPTQLGVHDVAFPRLNSAAFWFLPGGLIMLCQLVCVDRKYQRMNCFNIRELQGILKRKFFTDLVNTSDSHKAMESTLINMRHKNNMSNILMYDQSLFYNFDLTNTSKSKIFNFNPGKVYTYTDFINLSFITKFSTNNVFYVTTPLKALTTLLKDLVSFIYIPTLASISSILNSCTYLPKLVSYSLLLNTPKLTTPYLLSTTESYKAAENTSNAYISSTLNHSEFITSSPYNFSENSST
jgi:hypothetical protein